MQLTAKEQEKMFQGNAGAFILIGVVTSWVCTLPRLKGRVLKVCAFRCI